LRNKPLGPASRRWQLAMAFTGDQPCSRFNELLFIGFSELCLSFAFAFLPLRGTRA